MLNPNFPSARQFRDSGQLSTSNSSIITAGSLFIFDLDERFIPYDDVLIINLNSTNDCTIKINQIHEHPLPAGNKVSINSKNVTQIMVINNGTTSISANEIKVFYRNTGHEGKTMLEKGGSILNAVGNISLVKGFFR